MKKMICYALLAAFGLACGDEFPDTPCPDGTEQDKDTGLCIDTVTVIEYRDPEPEPFPCPGRLADAQDNCYNVPVEPIPENILFVGLAPDTMVAHIAATGHMDMFMKFILAGITGDSVVNKITLTLKGVGADTNIGNVYLYEGGTLIAGGETIDPITRTVSFNALNLAVVEGQIRSITVFADVQPTLNAGDTAGFSIVSPDHIETDSLLIGGIPIDGNLMAFTAVEVGTLAAQIADSTPDSRIILGGSVNVPVAIFRFNATDEAVLVRELTLSNCLTAAPDTDGDCADPDETPGEDAVATVVRISYRNQVGATVTDTGFLFQGTVTFNNMDMLIPANGAENVRVMVDTNTVSADGVASGSQLQLNLNAVAGAGPFGAVGTISGVTFTERDMNTSVVANPMVIRRTKPTVSLASGSPSGAGVPGLSEVFRFNISADARGYVEVNQVVFAISATDNDSTGWITCANLDSTKWALYDAADPSTPLLTSSYGYGRLGEVCGRNTRLRYLVMTLGQLEIMAGETRTFVFRLDTTGASSSSDDSIRIDITDQIAMDSLNIQSMFIFDGALTWTDQVASHIDGSLVKNLPVTGGTIVY